MLARHKIHNLVLITQHVQKQMVHLHALKRGAPVGLSLGVFTCKGLPWSVIKYVWACRTWKAEVYHREHHKGRKGRKEGRHTVEILERKGKK